MRLAGIIIFSLLILFGGSSCLFATEYAYLTISVRSNLNHKPIAHAKIRIHTTSNYTLWSVPEVKEMVADQNGNARFVNIRRIDLKQGGSKKNPKAYMRLQFDITASAPGFEKSHQRVFLDYEKPRPRTTIYLAPSGGGRKNGAKQRHPQPDPFEDSGYCPDSDDCSQRGQKVTCKQVGGKWQCWTQKYSAHTDDRYQAIGMACGCMNATNWDIERRQRSKASKNQTIQSLPPKTSKSRTVVRQSSQPARSGSHQNLPASTFKPDNGKAENEADKTIIVEKLTIRTKNDRYNIHKKSGRPQTDVFTAVLKKEVLLKDMKYHTLEVKAVYSRHQTWTYKILHQGWYRRTRSQECEVVLFLDGQKINGTTNNDKRATLSSDLPTGDKLITQVDCFYTSTFEFSINREG